MFLIGKDFWEVKKTKNKGLGLFAKREIKKGTVIGDYLGKLIDNTKYDPILEKNGLYLMYYTDEASIFPNLKKPDIHLMNHSCLPNCAFHIYRGHTLFFAYKNIKPGAELTISYMLSPKQNCINCTHDCNCGSKSCTKTMHLTEKKFEKWQKYQNTKKRKTHLPKTIFGKNLPKLSSYPKIITNNYFLQNTSF